jgi:hypothetical protein
MKKLLLLLGFAIICMVGNAQLTAPFTESFDATTIPAGWTNTSTNTSTNANWRFTGTPGNPSMGTSSLYQPAVILDHTGNAGSRAWVDGSTPNVDDTGLLTDTIDVSALTNSFAEFWFYTNNVTNPGDNMTLYVNFYDGTTWHDSIWGFAGDVNFWQYAGIDLSGYTISGGVLLEFVVDQTTAGTAFYNDILLDDFSVIERPACITPLAISNTATTNVTADFQYTGTASSYSIIYGPADFDPATSGTVVAATSTTPTVSSLTATTTYDAYFISNCGASSSDTSGGIRFTTLVNCPDPSGLSVSATTTTSATLDWTSGGSSAWLIEYGAPGFTPGTGTVVNAATNTGFVLGSLTAGTYYEVYVRDYCAPFSDTSNYVGPAVVQTVCNPTTVAYTNDFETEVDGLVPACWLQYSNVSNGYARTENLGAPLSGTQQLAIYSGASSAGDTIAAISPQLSDLTVGDKQLNFFAKTSNAATNLVIGTLSSTDISTATFTLLDTIFFSGVNTYEQIIYNISTANGYNGTDQYIAFLNTAGTTLDYIYIDDFSYITAPSCAQPTALGLAEAPDSSSARIYFTSNASASNYEYEFGPTGFTQGTNAALIVAFSNDTANVTGLQPNTTYDVYIRNVCGPGDVSAWSTVPVTFTTACGAFTAPYFTDFEADALDVPPLCWVDYETRANSFVEVENFTGTNGPFSGSQALYLYSGSATSTADTLLVISPLFSDLIAGDKRLRFQMSSDDPVSSLYVGTISEPSINGVFTPMDTLVVSANDTYEQFIVNFDAANGYNSTDQYIVFAHSLGATFDYIRIDDLNYETIPACIASTNFALSADSLSDSRAFFTWDAGQGSSYTLEWGALGYVPFTGNEIGTATVTDTFADITTLMPTTTYDFYLVDSCGNNVSLPVGPITLTTPAKNTITTIGTYPDNNGSSAVSFEIFTSAPINLTQITNVFNAGVSSSDVWIRQGGVANAPLNTSGDLIVDNASGWTNVQTTTVSGGGGTNSSPVPLQGLTPIFIPGGSTVGVVITGGMRYANTGSTPLLPTDFVNGPVTLRTGGTIGGALYGHGGVVPTLTNQPRGFLGSIAYDIAIDGNCSDAFADFVVDSISGNAAKISWTPGASNSSFYFEYGAPGFLPGGGTKITGTYPGAQPPIILTNLSPLTTYDYYFGEICNSGADSVYFSGVQSFTTLAGCIPPTNVDVSTISDTGVALVWDLSTSGGDYEVWFGPQGFYQGSLTTGGIRATVGSAVDSLYIDTLSALNCYEYVVRTKCLPNDSSAWIGPIDFCTPCAPIFAPYAENFDNTTAPTETPCWTFINNGSSTTSNVSTSTVRSLSPSNSVEIEYWTGTGELMLVSPLLGDFDNLKRIRFNVWDDDNTSDLIVGTMSNPTDPSTFTPFQTITAAEMPDQQWQEFRVFFGTYTGNDKYVAFSHGQNTTTDQFYIDDFIYEQPTCFDPTSFTSIARSANSVTLSWTSGGATSWEVEYGPVGYTPGSGTIVTANTNTNFVVPSLSSGTTYDFYVRDVCGPTDKSLWTGPVSDYTSCTSALSGVYTIGATGDYTSFAAVGQALGICGVSGPVTFNIQPGYYNDHLHIQGIPGIRKGVPGVSSTNTITFNGSGSDTLEWDGLGAQSAVWVDSTSYVTLNNMYIINDVLSEGWGVLITDNSDNVSIINNTIYMDSTGVSRPDKAPINVSGNTENDLTTGATADDLIITGNNLYGGVFSASIYGGGTARADFSQNVTFNNNTLYGFYTSGVYVRYYDGVTMNGNTVRSTTSAIDEDGLYVLDCDNYTIEENDVYVKDFALYILDGNDGAGVTANSTIINNMLISENDYAMYLNDLEDTDVWHNTTKGEPALRLNDQINVDIQNNIFATENDFAFESDDDLNATDEVNYNIYYRVSSGDPFDIGTAGTYTDLAAWQAGDLTKNVNSLDGDPLFVASNDVHVFGGLANEVGNNTLGILVDIDGDVRPSAGATIVDIGADEFVPVSGDFDLVGADFDKNTFCLSTTDTIVLYAANIVGSPSDLSVNPLVATYNVTGPVNSSGTITLNTGTINVGDTAFMRAVNIDLSIPGEYILNAYIDPNADNALDFNDTLAFNSVTIRVDSILTVTPKSTTVLGATDTLIIKANSPFFGGGSFHFTEIMHFRTATGTPTGGFPSYMGTTGTDLDEYVEITGVPGSDLAGFTFEQWNTTGTAPTGTITFPSGTVIGPNGTALFTMRAIHVTSPSDFLYDGSGGNTVDWQSGSGQGVILKDPSGNIVDAAGYPSSTAGYTFPTAANVPASEWGGGTPGSAATTCGVRLEGADVNDATNWIVSSVNPQDPNTVNAGVIVPAPISVTGFDWSLNGGVRTTEATDTVVASLLTPGSYDFVATFSSPCGITYTDTVTVVIPSCFAPSATSLTASVLSSSSATIGWDTTGLGSSANFEIEYGPLGYTAGTGTSVAVSSNNTGAITGLTQNVCVDVYVRTACSSTDFSPWVGPIKACPLAVPCDDMDGYAAGLVSNEESALFIEWQGAGGDGAFSTTRAQSGSNSLHIIDADGAAGAQFSDIVAYFDTIDNGAWDISFSMYVETGDGAYYNVQQNHVAAGAAGTNLWGCDIYFDNTGTATVQYANPAVTVGTFAYAQGQWIDINTVIDLDNDSIWVEYNGTSTGIGWNYSAANPGEPLQFNGVNFYSGVLGTATYDIDFYVDDFCITARASSCPMPSVATVGNVDCDNVDVNFSSSTGSSLIQYGPAGFTLGSGTYSGVLSGATTFNIPGLTVNTNYDVYVANVCASGDTSMFAGPLSITPTGPAPVASFNVVSLTGFVGSFDAGASTGGNLTYSWDFGDGSPAGSGVTTGHTFLANGVVSVTLTVTNACGSDDTTIVLGNVDLIENPLSQSLSLYPNPTEGVVNIDFSAFGKEEANIRIIDLRGKEVRRFTLKTNDGQFSSVLDLSELARGVYSIEVSTADLKAVHRIIKQ